MLEFQPLILSDKDRAQKYLSQNNYRLCESSFVDLFIWNNKNHFELSEKDGYLFARFLSGGKYRYLMPFGRGDLAGALGELIEDAKTHEDKLSLFCITDLMREQIEQALPGRFEFTDYRDWADYIYTAESLMTLSGKKLHGKRNFVNRFRKQNADEYSYEPISRDNMCDVWKFQKEWCRKNNGCSDESLVEEAQAIAAMLDHFEQLGAVGGMLRLKGKVIAFTIGSRISEDTIGVQIEKADADIPGAYQMINWEFANHEFRGYTYVNREEDMGMEGLRKAKLSYYPEIILTKHTAVLTGE